MSPNGEFDKQAQIKSLGSLPLYLTNQWVIKKGDAISEQLDPMGIASADLDLVLLSHLDCDHVNGLKLVNQTHKIMVSKEELDFAENGTLVNIEFATTQNGGLALKWILLIGTERKVLQAIHMMLSAMVIFS